MKTKNPKESANKALSEVASPEIEETCQSAVYPAFFIRLRVDR